MINIINLKKQKPKDPWDIRVDRSSPLGNPFPMKDESSRNKVCDQYEDWFHYAKHDKRFFKYLETLLGTYKKHGKLNLFCWCTPKRCHAETIKKALEDDLNFFKDKS